MVVVVVVVVATKIPSDGMVGDCGVRRAFDAERNACRTVWKNTRWKVLENTYFVLRDGRKDQYPLLRWCPERRRVPVGRQRRKRRRACRSEEESEIQLVDVGAVVVRLRMAGSCCY